MRVIVTRPAAQALPFVDQLRRQGLEAVALPLIGIEPVADPSAVQQAWQAIGALALVMFVSANAVEQFFTWRPEGRAWPRGPRAGSTGPGTSAALRAAGVPSDAIDEPPAAGPFDTETLWQRLHGRDWSGKPVLVVRGEDGRDWLAQQLRAAGADVRYVAAYGRVAPLWGDEQQALVRAALAAPGGVAWHFSSSEAIAHLIRAWPAADWSASQAWATHARIAARARAAGFGRVLEVPVGAEALATWWRHGGGVVSPGRR